MKESIQYYYNFNIAEVENYGEIYRFTYLQELFYFVPFLRSMEELEDIVEISKELKLKGIEVHDILLNKMGKILTPIHHKNYILLKPVCDIYQEYDLASIVKINESLILSEHKSKLYRNSWASLWSSKIDYFEYQIREIGKDKTLVLDSFSYYVGLGENAISYLNATNEKYRATIRDRVCLSHRRITYPNYALNYLNPLSFIFDLEVRDLASYIKSAFFAGEDALSYVKELLRLKQFSIYSYQLFYARLMYPSYYFDLYEKIMNDHEEEEILIPILEKAQDYETFLKDVYYEISRYVVIDRVEWLLKEK